MDKDNDLFEQLCGSYNCHFCCQCGEEATKELNNGNYACDNCLNNLGKEQQELKEEIENSLFDFGFDNYEDVTNCIDIFIDFIKYAKAWSTIKNLDHLDKSLEAINLSIKMENGLLDKETEELLYLIVVLPFLPELFAKNHQRNCVSILFSEHLPLISVAPVEEAKSFGHD